MSDTVSRACDGSKPSEVVSDLQTSGQSANGGIQPKSCSFAEVTRDVWGAKAPIAVEEYTGRLARTCRAWTSAEYEAPSSIAFDILRGKEGYRFLARVMRDDPPDWWLVLQRALAVAKLADEFGSNLKKLE